MALCEKKLTEILSIFGVPIQMYGCGEAKRIVDFCAEINAGESYLRIDEVGVSRIVEIVKMYIYKGNSPKGRVLKEMYQILPDGRKKERNQEPSGKMKPSESPREALTRELHEEIRLEQGRFTFEALQPRIESRNSKSYPGIACVYVIHPFNVFPEESWILSNATLATIESDGTRIFFGWSE